MGGPATLVIDAPVGIDGEAVLEGAEARLNELEQRFSRYRDDSLVSVINQRAGTGVVTPLDPEARALFALADQLWRFSGGRFDVTSGVLRHAWDFKAGQAVEPERLAELVARIGWSRVSLNDAGIALPDSGMELDLGGLAKEYAADAVVHWLRAAGISHGLVELAGDIATLGGQAGGDPWRVGIRDPHRPGDSLLTVGLADAAVTTSGGYERQFDHQGRRLHHLLDPETGLPGPGPISVTVLGDNCLTAGAIATVACLTPEDLVPAWLDDAGLPWLMVGRAGALFGPLCERATPD